MQYFALLEAWNGKTKDKLGGHHPDRYIADSRNMRMEETRRRQRRMGRLLRDTMTQKGL